MNESKIQQFQSCCQEVIDTQGIDASILTFFETTTASHQRHSNLVPSSISSELKETLSELIQDREEDEDNSIPASAILASTFYFQSCSLKGSYASNWIDISILRKIEALIRRWGDSQKQDGVKRFKRDYTVELQLISSLVDIAKSTEFWNMNKDARDALIDTLVASMAFMSCLNLDQTLLKDIMDAWIDNLKQRCVWLVQQEELAEEEVDGQDDHLLASSSTSHKTSHANMAAFKEMMITLLRASFPIITHQVDLPNGHRGKVAADKIISSFIQGFMESIKNVLPTVAMNAVNKSVLQDKDGATRDGDIVTPTKYEANKNSTNAMTSSVKFASTTAITPSAKYSCKKTPKSHRKSIDGIMIAPPSLKKQAMTPRSKRKSLGASTPTNSSNGASLSGKYKGTNLISSTMIGFLQKLSTVKGMERAEFRSRIANFILKIVLLLQSPFQHVYVKFVQQLSKSKLSLHRMFAVEMISLFLMEDSLWNNDLEVEEKVLMECLSGRIQDRAPAVRTRAICALSALIQSANQAKQNQETVRLVDTMVLFQSTLLKSLRIRTSMDDKATVRRAAIMALSDLLLFNRDTLHNDDIHVLCQMCSDASIAVRKSAVDAIVALYHLMVEAEYQPKDAMNVSGKESNHASLEALEVAWVDSVLPLVYDTENACATKVLDSFLEIIIDPIVESAGDGVVTLDEDESFAVRYASSWRILARINTVSSSAGSSKGGKSALMTVLKKSFEVMQVADQKSTCVALFRDINANIVGELENAFSQDKDGILSNRLVGSWCLLEGITSLSSLQKQGDKNASLNVERELKRSAIGTQFLVDCWDCVSQWFNISAAAGKKNPRYLSTAKSCLRVMSTFAPLMTEEEAMKLFQSLKGSLQDMKMSIDLIGTTVNALMMVTQRLSENDSNAVQNACEAWILDVMNSCEQTLDVFVKPNGYLPTELGRSIHTIGECMMVGFSPSESSIISKSKKSNNIGDTSGSNLIKGLRFKPSKRLSHLLESLLLPTLPRDDNSPEVEVPSDIRAHAFVSYGKMCLRDEALARNSINIFARELLETGSTSDPAVKSNALLVLGDFCVRYTHHVDKFLPLMASCLQPISKSLETDSSEKIVRHHALLILSNLILQDYIKWKGSLFYRFLAATVDEDQSISNLARLMLCGPLLAKRSNLFYNNFVDSLFVLNGCTAHPLYTNKDKKSAESQAFTVDALDAVTIHSSVDRTRIYNMLLDHMSDEEKIGVTARLSKEILSAATDLKGELSAVAKQSLEVARVGGAYSVLFDCFNVLTSSKMHIGRAGPTSGENDLDTSLSATESNDKASSNITKALLSKISRKHLIESVLPILINLKSIFEKNRSPLLKNLMQYLVCIFRQFNKEVAETLVSDQTLLKEIEYDTKQFEKFEKKRGASQLEETQVEVAVF